MQDTARRAGRRTAASSAVARHPGRCAAGAGDLPQRKRECVVLRYYLDLSRGPDRARAGHLGRNGQEPDRPGLAATTPLVSAGRGHGEPPRTEEGVVFVIDDLETARPPCARPSTTRWPSTRSQRLVASRSRASLICSLRGGPGSARVAPALASLAIVAAIAYRRDRVPPVGRAISSPTGRHGPLVNGSLLS